MAEQCCDTAEQRLLVERRFLVERRSPTYKRLEARLHQTWGTPIVLKGGPEGFSGYVGMTDELQAAWNALEGFEYERAERLAVKAERKAKAMAVRAERAARRQLVEVAS